MENPAFKDDEDIPLMHDDISYTPVSEGSMTETTFSTPSEETPSEETPGSKVTQSVR